MVDVDQKLFSRQGTSFSVESAVSPTASMHRLEDADQLIALSVIPHPTGNRILYKKRTKRVVQFEAR